MNANMGDRIAKALGFGSLRPFKPTAYYDSHMDCIRIELRDCSFTEERFNEHVTFLEDNYPGARSTVAGLMIKGVKHLFKEQDIALDGIIYVTSILNRMVSQYPDLAEKRILKLVKELDLTVDMSQTEVGQELALA